MRFAAAAAADMMPARLKEPSALTRATRPNRTMPLDATAGGQEAAGTCCRSLRRSRLALDQEKEAARLRWDICYTQCRKLDMGIVCHGE